jgi:Ca-activated chloride channel family protein
MLRSALAIVVVAAFAAPARAGSLPSRMGMFTPTGATLAMLDSKVAVSVHGPIVEATVTQSYRNESDRAVEATYIFPLPEDAAVSAMAIDYGTRKIHAAIALRKEAQRRYEEAVSAGVGAALLDQERPDVFTQTVSAIPAHGTVSVTLRFDTVARFDSGTWQMALPMVVAPRYVPGAASGRATTGAGHQPDTDRAPDASRVTPSASPGGGGKTEVTIAFGDAVEDVASPTHEIGKRGEAYAFSDDHSDHDAIVRWRAKVPSEGWVEQDDDGGYAAVLVEAPPAAARKAALRTMIVLSRAATARGDTDAMARPLVRALLGALDSKDSVSVTGSIQTDWKAPDEAARATESAWNGQSGAFDLTKVLTATKARGASVVLVSDGLVADDKAAVAAARQVGAPIHVIGVGPAPNRSLLAAIASATGGTVRYAVVGDDLGALAKSAMADLAAPPAALTVSWGALAARDVVPAQLPRLGAGQALLVLARVDKARTTNARARGDVFMLASIATPHAPLGALTAKGPLARRWARVRLDELVAAGGQGPIASHAIRYGLVSPMTSMIAVGDEVVVEGGVKHTVPVPVSVPAGMHWQAVKQELAVDMNSTTTGTTEVPESPKHAKATETKKNAPKTEDDRRPVKEKRHEEPVAKAPPPRQNAPVPAEEPPPAPQPKHPKQPKRDADEDDDVGRTFGAGDGSPDAGSPSPTTINRAPSPKVASEGGEASGDYEDDKAETVSLSGESVRSSRRLRFSVATGVANEAGNTNLLVAPRASFDIGGRTRFGIEGSLWFVGSGLDLEGTVLATFSRIGLSRWLDLQGGLGLHLGNGAGPAGAVELRVHLPVRHVATYLRYDGALLLHDHTRDGLNAGSVGVEASF